MMQIDCSIQIAYLLTDNINVEANENITDYSAPQFGRMVTVRIRDRSWDGNGIFLEKETRNGMSGRD
jgi:hypothetical protein